MINLIRLQRDFAGLEIASGEPVEEKINPVQIVTIKNKIPLFKGEEQANSIEKIEIEENGFSLVSQKDLYEIGDKAVYIQPDYSLSDIPLFESFIRPFGDPKKSKLGSNYRIRAVKFNLHTGDESPTYSVGILLPIEDVVQYIHKTSTTPIGIVRDSFYHPSPNDNYEWLTETLGITKWEEPEHLDNHGMKVNKPKYVGEKGMGWEKRLWALTFSLVIPDHIHNYLIGKTVHVSNGIIGNKNEVKTYSKDNFPKTITDDNVKGICNKYFNICQDYLWLKNLEKAELTKVIFYEFKNNCQDFKSSWDGSNFGEKSQLNYRYIIGYISKNDHRYNETKRLINNHYDREFYSYKYVKWSEERESFFKNIYESFQNITKRLDDFEKNISEQNLDNLISVNTKLLG